MQNADRVHHYFTAWAERDLRAIEALLAPDVEFVGPMASLVGRRAVVDAFAGVMPMMEAITMRKLVVDEDGGAAAAFYDFLAKEPVGQVRMAEMLELEDGRITHCEMFFDPTAFAAPSQPEKENAR